MFKVLKLYFPEPGEPGEPGNDNPPAPKEKDNDYTKIITNLKANSVPKSEYDKLEKSYKEALTALASGDEDEEDAGKVIDDKPDINKIKKSLFIENNGMNNLEYATLALQYRDAMIEQKGIDPFLPSGSGVDVTEEDKIKADNVAEVFEQCIEQADGDSEVFTALLQSKTQDALPLKNLKKWR